MEVIRGSQGPVLARAVGEQLIAERKVMDEGAERKAVCIINEACYSFILFGQCLINRPS